MNAADSKERAPAPGVYHPPLFALVPLLGLYAQNAGKVPWSSVLRVGVILVLAACVVWVLFAMIAGNRRKGAMAASVLIFAALPGWTLLEYGIEIVTPLGHAWGSLVWHLAYAGAVVAAFVVLVVMRQRGSRGAGAKLAATVAAGGALGFFAARVFLTSVFGQAAGWLIAIYLLGVGVVLAVVLGRSSDFIRSTRTANWFASILVLLFAANCVYQYPRDAHRAPPPLDIQLTASESEEGWPDIYVILLDGYARADVLRMLYGYNNGPFLASLRAMGFEVAEDAVSNYPNTMTSLASCLNMEYLDSLLPREEVEDGTLSDVADLCHNTRLFRFLREQGYVLMAFSPGLAMREPRSPIDVCLCPSLALSEFEMVLLSSVAPGRAVQVAYHLRHGSAAYWSHAFLRERVVYAFDELGRIAAEESAEPRFVFAQLTIPGPPFLFDREGQWSLPAAATQRVFGETFRGTPLEFRERYRAQLHYVNHLIEKSLREIVAASKRPTVFVLASDHGPLLRGDGEQLDRAARQEQFGTLLAVRFPEGTEVKPGKLDDSTSLVNLFRVTLNRVFGTNLEYLPNRSFYTSAEHPFETVPAQVDP